jgi:hypothetical protein
MLAPGELLLFTLSTMERKTVISSSGSDFQADVSKLTDGDDWPHVVIATKPIDLWVHTWW